METISLELMLFLILTLGCGSSLIHYTAFAKARAKVRVDEVNR